jgi:hypothetical protein
MDEVIDWLTFYNHRRLHSTMGYISPMRGQSSAARRQPPPLSGFRVFVPGMYRFPQRTNASSISPKSAPLALSE